MKPLDHMFVLVAMFGCSPSTNATRIDGGPSADSSVGDTSEDDEIDDVPEDAPDANYKIFNPADYAGYDPTGATESSEAFQAAIDAASARTPTGHFLIIAREHTRPAVARPMSTTGG
jgi:hypothetical protein